MRFWFGDKEDREIFDQYQGDKTAENSNKEERNKRGKRLLAFAIPAVAFFLAFFHLYTAYAGAYQSLIQRSIHVSAGITLVFLYQLEKNQGKTWLDKINSFFCLIIIFMSILICSHILINFKYIMSPNFRISNYEIFLAVCLILIVLETARRIIGLAIPILATIFIFYTLFGNYIPNMWGHNGIRVDNLLSVVAFSDRGIWGSITGVSATIIATFVIFGSILFATGGGKTFIDLANVLAGRAHGGAAKLATIASSLFGTVSGSASANVATTGAFTIPLMKRLGYSSEFAGAVECSASAGGQIMPPIMGAGAFIMADLLGMPYVGILSAAVLPAFMYYFGIFIAIDCAARKFNYKGLPEEEIVPLKQVFYYKNFVPVFIPIALLIFFFLQGYTAVTCASYSIFAAIIVYIVIEPKEIKNRVMVILLALQKSAKSMLSVLSLIACAQILVCLISLTGIGVKFSNMIMALGGDKIIYVGILAMCATMLLGMGMPTVAAYVLSASVIAPALVRIGIEPIAAHFFVFYYSIFAGLTPPVCGTVYVGSAMAESNWLKTAFLAMRLSIGAFIIPFMFLFSPALLLKGTFTEIFRISITCLFGMTALASGGMGYLLFPLNLFTRILFMVSGVLLVSPDHVTDFIGIVAFISTFCFLWVKNRKNSL